MKTIYKGWKSLNNFITVASGSRIKFLLVLIALFFQTQVSSQIDSTGAIKVLLLDKATKEAIPFANVVAKNSRDIQIAVATTNMDGEAWIRNLKAGTYNLKAVYVGYEPCTMNKVLVREGKTSYVTLSLSEGSGATLESVSIVSYQIPLIDPDTKSGQTVTREDYQNMATKNINSVAGKVRGGRSSFSNSSTTSYQNDSPLQNNYSEEIFEAGKLTASELNDFKKWNLFKDYTEPSLLKFQAVWNMYPDKRYLVQLMNTEHQGLADIEVILYGRNEEVLWKARTDNTGKAELWNNFFGDSKTAESIKVNYNNEEYSLKHILTFQEGINRLIIETACNELKNVDILFMVDATSSMDDEINYLKAELNDVMQQSANALKTCRLRTAGLFYRCIGNSYVTKASPFNEDLTNTLSFIKEQHSAEGGLEAVEIALQEAVNDFEWTKTEAVRILFIVMDEPPGADSEKLQVLRKAIKLAAEKGIRVVPLIASGGTDSDFDQKSMEYLMRSIALATNGSYAFLTDHSGVGNPHAKPVTPEYKVELLNKLLLRIIHEFSFSACQSLTQLNDEKKDSTWMKVLAHVILDSTHVKNNQVLENESKQKNNEFAATNNFSSEDLIASNKFRYYPNPTSGELQVECELKELDFYLCDANAKMLQKYTVNKREKLLLNLGDFPNGLYFIKFKRAEQWQSAKLILVSN